MTFDELISNKDPVEVLRMVAADMSTDATAFERQPFDGPTVARYLGNLGAGIEAIALVLAHDLEERRKAA